MSETNEQNSQDAARVQKLVDDLGEFYDTVHVFCTRHEPTTEGGTLTYQRGKGNWFARYGQIRDWLTKQEEQTKLETRKDFEEDGQ